MKWQNIAQGFNVSRAGQNTLHQQYDICVCAHHTPLSLKVKYFKSEGQNWSQYPALGLRHKNIWEALCFTLSTTLFQDELGEQSEIQCNTFTKKQKNNASSHLSAILQYYNIIIMSFPYRVNSSSPRNVNYIVSSRLIFLRLLSSIVSLHLSPDAISYISSFVSSSVFLIPNRRSYLPLYRATFTLLTLPLCHTHFLCPPASAETS